MSKIYLPSTISSNITSKDILDSALENQGYNKVQLFMNPTYIATPRYTTNCITVTGNKADGQDLENFTCNYTLTSRDTYDECSGNTLYLKLPELRFKEGYTGKWNRDIFINIINSCKIHTDSLDTLFFSIERDMLNFIRFYVDNKEDRFEYEIGNRSSLLTPSNHIESEEISFTFPVPWCNSYYPDKTRCSNSDPFPLYAIGGGINIIHTLSFNLNPDKLIKCYNNVGDVVTLEEAYEVKLEIPIPKNIFFFQKRTPFEKELKGIEKTKDLFGEDTSNITYIIETFSEVFGGSNTQDSGTTYNIEGIRGENVKEIIFLSKNETLSEEEGRSIYTTRRGTRLNSDIKFRSDDRNFDTTGYMSEVIVPGQQCYNMPRINCGIGIFKDDIYAWDDPRRSKTSFDVKNGRLEIKTFQSKNDDGRVDKIKSKCYLRSIIKFKIHKGWNGNTEKMGYKNKIEIIKGFDT